MSYRSLSFRQISQRKHFRISRQIWTRTNILFWETTVLKALTRDFGEHYPKTKLWAGHCFVFGLWPKQDSLTINFVTNEKTKTRNNQVAERDARYAARRHQIFGAHFGNRAGGSRILWVFANPNSAYGGRPAFFAAARRD